MVVGGGGREHALIKAVAKNPHVDQIFALPGNAGTAELAQNVPIAATDIEGMTKFALDAGIDFAVVAPDDPLVLGAVDSLEGAGIPCFGPTARAAEIEGSKSFAKQLMADNSIPTAAYETFTELDSALTYLDSAPYPLVVKADGLALGKGVVIAQDAQEAKQAATEMLSGQRFGVAGQKIVVEEFLTGPEVTVLAFTDGHTLVPMVSSMDHKRIFDGDEGPNTGGMGVVAPNPFYTDAAAELANETIFAPTVAAMNALDRPFKGCLYFGLILTDDGPKVIEYNCRFGDPEAQAVLPLLRSDLLTVMQAVREGTLADVDVSFSSQSSCTVVLASAGYPESAEKGQPVTVGNLADNTHVYHAGTTTEADQLVTNGGRVLAVTAVSDTLEQAVADAYEGAKQVSFPGSQMRTDIGARALSSKQL